MINYAENIFKWAEGKVFTMLDSKPHEGTCLGDFVVHEVIPISDNDMLIGVRFCWKGVNKDTEECCFNTSEAVSCYRLSEINFIDVTCTYRGLRCQNKDKETQE